MMQEQYWTMRNGTKIAVGDMEVKHLRNILRMLLRVGFTLNKSSSSNLFDLENQDMTYSDYLTYKGDMDDD